MLQIYQPQVTHAPIYFPRCGKPPYLRYNHCVDVIRFKGKFIAAWNANVVGEEGAPGQFNFVSFSDDYVRWTPPVKIFAGESSIPPVCSDRQWQPSFLNWKDRILFCAWCDTKSHKTYVAESLDGRFWRNREISDDGIPEGTVAFPTNHGLVAGGGSFYFPVSFAPPEDFSICRYAGVLISRDHGKRWHWSRCAEAQSFQESGITPEESPLDRPSLWEPMVYESSPGKLGMLIRNNINQAKNPSILPEHMMLFAESSDRGETWSKARFVEIETLCSRCFAERTEHGLLLAMNDWPRGGIEAFSEERFHLTLYCGPNGNPDLLLPGPEIQPPGDRGFYPNGFRYEEKLYLGCTYPPNIWASVVQELPPLDRPFLLPRQSREGLRLEEDGFCLLQPQATAGLFIPETMVNAERVRISFETESMVRSESDFTVLTLGGKSHAGLKLILRFDPENDLDRWILRNTAGDEFTLGECFLHRKNIVEVTLLNGRTCFRINGNVFEAPGEVLRKIAFGGLYEPPIFPPNSRPVLEEVHVSAITVCDK